MIQREDEIDWIKLSTEAWQARDNAFIFGSTKVGASVLSENQNVYNGCNVEHKFRSHDVHAEVNAITNMISKGEKKMIAIIIVAERLKFTPCGGCMDWIMQHGGENCIVAYQNEKNGEIYKFFAKELMPHYPF